ncbi:putative Double-strand break repair protein MRE11 [Paratrimastix pyriformis]|uniref:Double-strand break repair protein n=1 Tax=Paratrimastix pyriformis TaxID=342808 RepID=A0ABQ8UFW5_9EUKA|nr:putative Double-strand break repair protein MRE11 [Paratrimastix pyriformis]
MADTTGTQPQPEKPVSHPCAYPDPPHSLPHSERDVVRILIATDNHLGAWERDPVRANDSFQAFHEILQQAKDTKVDFLLLGGDLFHDNKPSRQTMHRTMDMLRSFCLGSDPVDFRVTSDQSLNFPNSFASVNFEDPNYNISLPIFIVHGNHDDPSGEGTLSALDLLASSNLVNYFGMVDNLDNIRLYPILIEKGRTKIALYGLGNVHDERLHHAFLDQKVTWIRPVQDPEGWFNIFVIHQNREPHGGRTNHIPDTLLPDWLDIVIWAHEHECKIDPVTSINKFEIIQPGSSVVTQLTEGEAKPKHIGVLSVCGVERRFEIMPLKSQRPFFIDELVLPDGLPQQRVLSEIEAKVNSMIPAPAPGDPNPPMLPLVRLRQVTYSGETPVNPQMIGRMFATKVANPGEMIIFNRKRPPGAGSRKREPGGGASEMDSPKLPTGEGDTIRMEELIDDCLKDDLELLLPSELSDAVTSFVEKDEKDAIAKTVTKMLGAVQRLLIQDADASAEKDLSTMVHEKRAQLKPKATATTAVTATVKREPGGAATPPMGAPAPGAPDDFLNFTMAGIKKAEGHKEEIEKGADDDDDGSSVAASSPEPSEEESDEGGKATRARPRALRFDIDSDTERPAPDTKPTRRAAASAGKKHKPAAPPAPATRTRRRTAAPSPPSRPASKSVTVISDDEADESHQAF